MISVGSGFSMALNWINYLCFIVGYVNVVSFTVITAIVLKRNPKEKLNWIFALSFFFLAIAYALLPTGAFVYTETNPTTMVNLTRIYAFFLFVALAILMLSALAINYSTVFILKWYIWLPIIIIIATLGGLIFATDIISAVPGPNPDTKTKPLFIYSYYPLSLIVALLIYIYFIRAYKLTTDENLKTSLKFFLAGLSICLFSIIPNILSNALADIWENAQALNGLEFIFVLIGTTVLLGGFLLKSRRKVIESFQQQLQKVTTN